MLLRLAAMAMIGTALTACGSNTLYVSPNGNDTHAGTRDAPLATLAAVRDRLRTMGRDAPVTVVFAAGTYRFAEPVVFDERDAGAADARITYRAAEGAEVRFTGGVNVTGWLPLTDPGVLKRLDPAARPHVRVADLRPLGIDPGVLAVLGFGAGSPPAAPELSFDGEPMTLARWPNAGFRGMERKVDLQHVVADTERVARWADEPDPWIFAYWHHNWAELCEPIAGIDAAQRVIERSPTIEPRYGITANRARWYGLNLLCELDSPGEYYIDRDDGAIYFWPPRPDGTAVLSQALGILDGQGASHVTFRGITFECVRGTALLMDDATDVELVGCTFRNVGGKAVNMQRGTRHTVYGCDVSHCGAGGVSLSGGDRQSLRPGGHSIENNHVHHYSRRHRTYKPAIEVRGVGHRIAHNLIHHGPHVAISASGNNHVVEFNEVHNVVYESGDAGALYNGRDWTQRGTRIQYNHWHDIRGALGHGGMVIYQDDQHSGQIIHGNVFEHTSRAVFLGGGDDHVVTNNVFVNCWRSVHLDNRGMNWQKTMTTDPNDTLHKRLRAVPYQHEPWASQYPTLVGILDDDPGVPKRNTFERNVSAGGTWNDIKASIAQHQTIRHNLIYDMDPSAVTLVRDAGGKLIDIRFKDPQAVAQIGFEPIPVDRIGLYSDPRRASWPVERRVEPFSLIDLKIEEPE
jgi:hypothetical protein